MPADYLLDTGVLLHWIRASPVADRLRTDLGLFEASVQPLVCEVTMGELAAFALANKWGPTKRQALAELPRRLVAVDISKPEVVAAYADFSTLAKQNGWPLFHDKNDLWIAAATHATETTLLTLDRRAFAPLRDGSHLRAIIIGPDGKRLP